MLGVAANPGASTATTIDLPVQTHPLHHQLEVQAIFQENAQNNRIGVVDGIT